MTKEQKAQVNVVVEYPISIKSPVNGKSIRIIFCIDIYDPEKNCLVFRVGNLAADYHPSLKVWNVPETQTPYYFVSSDFLGINALDKDNDVTVLLSESYMSEEALKMLKSIVKPYLGTERGRMSIANSLIHAASFVGFNMMQAKFASSEKPN